MSLPLEVPDEVTLVGMIRRVLSDGRSIAGTFAKVLVTDWPRTPTQGPFRISGSGIGGTTEYPSACDAAIAYLGMSGADDAWRSLTTSGIIFSPAGHLSSFGTSRPRQPPDPWTLTERRCIDDLVAALQAGRHLAYCPPGGIPAVASSMVMEWDTGPEVQYCSYYGRRPRGQGGSVDPEVAALPFFRWCGTDAGTRVENARRALRETYAHPVGWSDPRSHRAPDPGWKESEPAGTADTLSEPSSLVAPAAPIRPISGPSGPPSTPVRSASAPEESVSTARRSVWTETEIVLHLLGVLEREAIVEGALTDGYATVQGTFGWRPCSTAHRTYRLVIARGVDHTCTTYDWPRPAVAAFVAAMGVAQASRYGEMPAASSGMLDGGSPISASQQPDHPDVSAVTAAIAEALEGGRELSWFDRRGRPMFVFPDATRGSESPQSFMSMLGWGYPTRRRRRNALDAARWFIDVLDVDYARAALRTALEHPVGWADPRHLRPAVSSEAFACERP